jgi:WD40 repeat protein
VSTGGQRKTTSEQWAFCTRGGGVVPRPERPLDAGDGILLRFAADLRRLRREAGNPTLKELGRQAHYAASTLSEAAGGRSLPSLAVTVAFVQACGGDVDAWEQRWRDVAAELTAEDTGDAENDGVRPPYVGLAAFGPEDAEWFFGRERLVDDLVCRLSRQRFVAVFGASGVGKSSLVRAGLVPSWQAHGESRSVVVFTPGPHPIEETAIRLARLTGTTPGQVHDELTADPRNLHRLVRHALADQPDCAELAVVVDQFEEVFTLCRDDDERDRFVDMLLAATQAENSQCRVVVGVRADFYAHCTRHPRLVETLDKAQVTVGPMGTDELRRAIMQPAARARCTLEAALVAELTAQAAGQAGVLPMLSHALLETWRRRRGNTLTLPGFQAAGGIAGALRRTAETLYGAMDPAQQRLAKDLFLRLTALGEGTEDTKRRIFRTELDTIDPNTELVLDRLARARLITLARDTVEITHEALIRCWPRLYGWLSEDRDGLRVYRQLTEAAKQWVGLDRDPDALWRGARLALAEDWLGTRNPALTAVERDFLTASQSAYAAELAAARRRSRRLRQLVALLTVLLVAAVTTGVLAVKAEQTAVRQRNIATSQRVANEAARLRGTRPALGAQLALAAYRLAPTAEARSSLLSTFATPYATLLTSNDGFGAVATSPDGRVLATASTTATLWDVTDVFHPRRLADMDTGVSSVTFSPQGNTLAVAHRNGGVRLWDTSNPRQPRETVRLDTKATTASFHPNGHLLATAGTLWDVSDPSRPRQTADLGAETSSVVFDAPRRSLAAVHRGTGVGLWDVTDPDHARETAHLDVNANAAAFNPAGNVLAVAGNDFTIKLWDVSDPGRPRALATLVGHTDAARAVVFAPDGRTLASGSTDASVRLWDVTDLGQPHELLVLGGHTGAVNSMAYSADGRLLITGSADHTTRLWDLSGPILTGHTNSVYAVAFSPDGRFLASGSYDTTVRLWDASDPRHPLPLSVITGHTAPVNHVVFSPDSRFLASGGYDTTVRLWDVADPRHPVEAAVFTGGTATVIAIAFSPDARTLITGNDDDTAKLWDVTDPHNPRQITTLTGHTDEVGSVAFSPDNRTLATASADRTVRLWDATDRRKPQVLTTLTGHTDSVKAVAFSPDGHLLVTASADRTTRLWNVTNPTDPQQLATTSGYADAVNSVAISSDNHTLAAASADRTIRLWDITNPRTPNHLATLTGHNKPVDMAAFHPYRDILATGGEDSLDILWENDPESVAAHICAITDPAISRAEWERYFPGLDFQPPCPL